MGPTTLQGSRRKKEFEKLFEKARLCTLCVAIKQCMRLGNSQRKKVYLVHGFNGWEGQDWVFGETSGNFMEGKGDGPVQSTYEKERQRGEKCWTLLKLLF